MNQAYLIIAHHEFDILKLLISKLDDERNDIYIHFDRKVNVLPDIETEHSRLCILDDRVDVRWGTVSQIEAEYKLFEAALKGGTYNRYCLISGTHLPLKNNDELTSLWMENEGKEILRLWIHDEGDADFKLRRFHFGIRNFNSPNKALRWFTQHLWTVNMRVQKIFRVRHLRNDNFVKSDNWVSLTDRAVRFLIKDKGRILEKYKYSFCGDEYFVATELSAHPERFTLENISCLLYVEFVGANPRAFSLSEYEGLCKTDYIFARKFTSNEQ